MVINNASFEEQLRRLLSEAQSELKTLEGEAGILRDQITIVAKEVSAYEVTLQGFLRRSGKQPVVDWDTLLANAKTHKDRIKVITEHHGVVRPNQLTDILYPRFIKSKKRANAYQIVQMNLTNMVDANIMEKSGPGVYRLIGSQQKLPGS
jgi:hypothetical protein